MTADFEIRTRVVRNFHPPAGAGIGARGGFTLIETIVALVLIVSALIGPFTLATRGIFSAKFAKSKIIAMNLTQEGIEIIRAMRDNNILSGADWRGLVGPCIGGCVRLQDGSYQPDIFTPATGSPPPVNTGSPMLLSNETGLYSQAAGSPTQFTRNIDISTPAEDQMLVVSTVAWTESGIQRSARLSLVIYNWK